MRARVLPPVFNAASVRIICELFGQELQSNFPLELQIFGSVHHAHTAAAKLLNNATVRNDLVQNRRKKSLIQVTSEGKTNS